MKRNYSILIEEDFLNYSEEELAKMQLASIDKNISFLHKLFILSNVMLIVPFVLFYVFSLTIVSYIVLASIILVSLAIKKRIDFKTSIRNFIYKFFEDNKLV